MSTDTALRKDAAFLIRYGSLYYVGGHPYWPDSYTEDRAKAQRYERAVAANVRGHVSAYTHGPAVIMERA
jgi:hypothetical protein